MNQYSILLDKLKQEISIISKKKKKFNKNQKIMINFINGKTNMALFNISGVVVKLAKGDEKKGFKHILLKHYNPKELDTMDILNIIDTYIRGLKLQSVGLGNSYLSAYALIKNQKDIRLIIDENKKPYFVITSYRKI